MAKKIRLFVYGTLKSQHGNNRVLDGATFLGRDILSGPYRFISLGWFPGVVAMPDDAPIKCIGGEVYEIDNDTLSTCDMIEGYPSFYTRKKVRTRYGAAWVYVLPAPYADHEPVDGLFWKQNDAEVAWEKENAAA